MTLLQHLMYNIIVYEFYIGTDVVMMTWHPVWGNLSLLLIVRDMHFPSKSAQHQCWSFSVCSSIDNYTTCTKTIGWCCNSVCRNCIIMSTPWVQLTCFLCLVEWAEPLLTIYSVCTYSPHTSIAYSLSSWNWHTVLTCFLQCMDHCVLQMHCMVQRLGFDRKYVADKTLIVMGVSNRTFLVQCKSM